MKCSAYTPFPCLHILEVCLHPSSRLGALDPLADLEVAFRILTGDNCGAIKMVKADKNERQLGAKS